MENKYAEISIPAELFKAIEDKIKDTDISSVKDYVVKVLKDSLSEGQKKNQSLSKDEEDKVKERLKALGYMD